VKVYQVKTDVNRYQHFVWEDESEYGQKRFVFEGVSLRQEWKSCPVYVLEPKLKKPDFWSVTLGSGGFAVSPLALERMRPWLEQAGELLPLEYEGEMYMVVNILPAVDCIDEQRSEWEVYGFHKDRRRLVKPVFNPDRLPAVSLFKSTHFLPYSFCWEKTGNPETEFKACVEANKLKGVYFKEVWSDS
jgi:hypothetical protein